MHKSDNRRIVINNKHNYFELSVKSELTILDLKLQIARYANLKIENYLLFYNNINLLEQYNTMTLGEVLNKVDIDNNFKEEIFTLISKEEFQILLVSTNKVLCLEHPTNSVYLYCKKCDLPICDRCKLLKHHNHKNEVIDQKMILSNFYKKLEHFEWKYNKSFGNVEISNLFQEFDSNLNEYVKSDINKIEQLANDLKKVIDEIKEIEVKRISELKNAAKSKLEDFKKEINFLTILKIRSKLIIINQIRRDQVLKFMT